MQTIETIENEIDERIILIMNMKNDGTFDNEDPYHRQMVIEVNTLMWVIGV